MACLHFLGMWVIGVSRQCLKVEAHPSRAAEEGLTD